MAVDDQAPMVQAPAIDEHSIFRYVRALLGGSTVKLETTVEDMQLFLEAGLELYSQYRPTLRWFSMPARTGVNHYIPKRDTVGFGVTEVLIPRIDPIAPLLIGSGARIDVFSWRYAAPYRDLAEIAYEYFYYSEAKKLLSSNFTWRWIDGGIAIHPRPDDIFALSYCAAHTQDIHSFPRDNLSWLREWVLSQVEQSMGNARGKFPMIGGAQSQQMISGQAVVDRGMARQEKLEAQVVNLGLRFPIMR